MQQNIQKTDRIPSFDVKKCVQNVEHSHYISIIAMRLTDKILEKLDKCLKIC